MTGASTGTGSPMSPGTMTVTPKKDDGKKKLQQFMHNARKVCDLPQLLLPCDPTLGSCPLY